MEIKWHEVTWYSKLGAIIFFIGVLPASTFYLGMAFQESTTPEVRLGGISATQVVPATPSTEEVEGLKGTYVRGDSSITVAYVRGDLFHITGEALISSATPDGEAYANVGDIDMTIPITNGMAHYRALTAADTDPTHQECIIDFAFRSNKVDITTDNLLSCDWGMGVDFAGQYIKK